jgi:mono/diheme cytochrome c family protein
MFRRPFLITVPLAATTAVFLLASTPGDGATTNASPEAVRLYGQYCLVCHGADGKGTAMKPTMPTIPDFTDRTWQESRTNVNFLISILEGKGTLMPAYSDRLTSEQAQEVVTHVRAFASAAAE